MTRQPFQAAAVPTLEISSSSSPLRSKGRFSDDPVAGTLGQGDSALVRVGDSDGVRFETREGDICGGVQIVGAGVSKARVCGLIVLLVLNLVRWGESLALSMLRVGVSCPGEKREWDTLDGGLWGIVYPLPSSTFTPCSLNRDAAAVPRASGAAMSGSWGASVW